MKMLQLWKCYSCKGINYGGVGAMEVSITKVLQLWRC
jgi:hypothetical protein